MIQSIFWEAQPMSFSCIIVFGFIPFALTFTPHSKHTHACRSFALSENYLENDLVAIRNGDKTPRLCVVRSDNTVTPLCQHEDDLETDLFLDSRYDNDDTFASAQDADVSNTYGEGWYGQRPVPSLGAGPGYGAEASEIWSIDQVVL